MNIKTKTKLLVAAIALAGAAQANAAIINMDNDPVNNTGGGTGAGNLFLSAFYTNGTISESYVLNTNVTTNQFRTSGFTFNQAADSNLQSLLATKAANGGSIVWTMGAIDNEGLPNNGYFATSPFTLTGANTPGIYGAQANLAGFENSVNTASVSQTVDNLASELLTHGNSALLKNATGYIGAGFTLGAWDSGNNSLQSAIGNAMTMYFVGYDPSNPALTTNITHAFGKWTLAANGALSYGAAAAPVPLPPAVWLLGSALVGLVGVGRRRNNGGAGLTA